MSGSAELLRFSFSGSNGQDVVVSQCRFICLHANTSSTFKAGPLYFTGASAITIDSTTAYDCWVVRATIYASWAIFLDSSGPIAISNSCGDACLAECAQFAHIGGRRLTGHSVNSSTMLACGNQDSITRAQSDWIDLENVSATLRNLNVMYCTGETVAVPIDAYGRNGCFEAEWLTVMECEAVTMVHLYHGPPRPVLEYLNVYLNNRLSRKSRNEAYGVVFARDYGMFIQHCTFLGVPTSPTQSN
jgi:hypothetical protein